MKQQISSTRAALGKTRQPLQFFSIVTVLFIECLALSPLSPAVTPAPGGGYPNENTAVGEDALLNLTTGEENTAVGADALSSNTTGEYNTATGSGALFNNTTADGNSAFGKDALFDNTTGFYNTAIGTSALQFNTTGTKNTASGVYALFHNTTGGNNTAAGYDALDNNTTGNNNTATGLFSLVSNTGGGNNTAAGVDSLEYNTTGINNTAVGMNALRNNSTGGSNIALGISAGINLTTGNNNIAIGNAGAAAESNTIRLGTKGTHKNTYIAGISGVTVAGGVGVVVDANGHLGVVTSSAHFKEEIKPMDRASEALLALKPVTFRYKHELDPEGVRQFGLVAEQVEKVNPDLVARDADGKVYTVRYEAVNAMLLNEFLKEHGRVTEQEATITELKSRVARQEEQMQGIMTILREQASQIQKVSGQFATDGHLPPAPAASQESR